MNYLVFFIHSGQNCSYFKSQRRPLPSFPLAARGINRILCIVSTGVLILLITLHIHVIGLGDGNDMCCSIMQTDTILQSVAATFITNSNSNGTLLTFEFLPFKRPNCATGVRVTRAVRAKGRRKQTRTDKCRFRRRRRREVRSRQRST